jgi:hypothetical protein
VTFEYGESTPFGPRPAVEVLDSSGNLGNFTDLQSTLEGFSLVTCNVPPPQRTCPLTIGYWKNHTSNWPAIFPVTIGGTQYSASDLETVLTTPTRGDAKIIMGQQLIAAILNVANGGPPTPLIDQAGNLLIGINLVTGASVQPSSPLGQQMVALGSQLENYNSNCER